MRTEDRLPDALEDELERCDGMRANPRSLHEASRQVTVPSDLITFAPFAKRGVCNSGRLDAGPSRAQVHSSSKVTFGAAFGVRLQRRREIGRVDG